LIEKINIFIEKIIQKIIKNIIEETAQIATGRFLKDNARKRPNSRLRFPCAGFYVPECYCTQVASSATE